MQFITNSNINVKKFLGSHEHLLIHCFYNIFLQQKSSSKLDNIDEMGDKELMRIMGLDIGEKTIGVAISDELGLIAQGLKTIIRKGSEEDFSEIRNLIASYQIQKIVVGLPKNMNGTLGKQAESVLLWIKELKERFSIPVVVWDERLSTVEATKTLLQADLSRVKRKRVINQLAASIILQGYLDRKRAQNDEDSPSP